jgi:hypothetical protein
MYIVGKIISIYLNELVVHGIVESGVKHHKPNFKKAMLLLI